MVTLGPEEEVGSNGLETHVERTLGIHLKLGFLCNHCCHSQLDLAFFLVNALGVSIFLDVVWAMGVPKAALETTLGFLPSTDLEAVGGLQEMPVLRFFLRDRRVLATHLE